MFEVTLIDGEYFDGVIVYTIKPDIRDDTKVFEEIWVDKAGHVNLSESDRGGRGDDILDFLKGIQYELHMQRKAEWVYIFRFKKEDDAALFKLRWG